MSFPVIIIGGPTAGGKSHAALELAARFNGEIINGDSMQVYSHLPVLTAQPLASQEIPHHLYGVLTASEGYTQAGSLAWWYAAACKTIQDVSSRGKIPVVVGGTGLYLRALTRGLSVIPEIPESIRHETRQLARNLCAEDFFALVSGEDARVKDIIHPHDTQRLCRALEVIRATQVSLIGHWGKLEKIIGLDVQYFIIQPPRPLLYERINTRFAEMVEKGAVEEVRNLLGLNIAPGSPLLKAIGVPELTAYLNQELTLEEAVASGQQATRRYAKRQVTWFGRQVPEAKILDPLHDFKRISLNF